MVGVYSGPPGAVSLALSPMLVDGVVASPISSYAETEDPGSDKLSAF